MLPANLYMYVTFIDIVAEAVKLIGRFLVEPLKLSSGEN